MAAGAVMPLEPAAREKLEERGVDSVRALLTSMADGRAGTGRGAALDLGGVNVSRGDMEDWLREQEDGQRKRERSDSRWLKAGTIVAIVGAIAAVAAAVFAYLAIPTPLATPPQSAPTVPVPKAAPPAASPQGEPPKLLPGTKFQQR